MKKQFTSYIVTGTTHLISQGSLNQFYLIYHARSLCRNYTYSVRKVAAFVCWGPKSPV